MEILRAKVKDLNRYYGSLLVLFLRDNLRPLGGSFEVRLQGYPYALYGFLTLYPIDDSLEQAYGRILGISRWVRGIFWDTYYFQITFILRACLIMQEAVSSAICFCKCSICLILASTFPIDGVFINIWQSIAARITEAGRGTFTFFIVFEEKYLYLLLLARRLQLPLFIRIVEEFY